MMKKGEQKRSESFLLLFIVAGMSNQLAVER